MSKYTGIKSDRTIAVAEYKVTPTLLSDGDRGEMQADQNGNLKASLATLIAGEDLPNNVLRVEDQSTYVNTTASVLIKTGAGRVKGIFVASASSTPTIKLWDNTSAATVTLVNTFTPTGATFYPFPDVNFVTGLFITISGTVDCTVFYQ